jgi:hypothetical protein
VQCQWAVEICYKKLHRRFRQSVPYNFPTFQSTVLEFEISQTIHPNTHTCHPIILRGKTGKYQGLYYILCGVKTRALTITYYSKLPQQGLETQPSISLLADMYVMSHLNDVPLKCYFTLLTCHTVSGISQVRMPITKHFAIDFYPLLDIAIECILDNSDHFNPTMMDVDFFSSEKEQGETLHFEKVSSQEWKYNATIAL